MVPFELPQSCAVGQNIPKNAFHAHFTPAQRKTLSKCIERINWTHKITSTNSNLRKEDIEEIQIFHLALRERNNLAPLCEAIEKVIPYTLILWLEFEGEAFISSSQKHPHAVQLNRAVIDWTFKSDWFSVEACPYSLILETSLDQTAKHLWIQLSGKAYDPEISPARIVEDQQAIYHLTTQITKLQSRIASERQFNRRVELNQQLQTAQRELKALNSIS
jgi:hypothetical protein